MCVARGDVEDPVTPLQPHEVSDSLISNVHVQGRARNFQAKNIDSIEVPSKLNHRCIDLSRRCVASAASLLSPGKLRPQGQIGIDTLSPRQATTLPTRRWRLIAC
jgi:hypothetical protein